MKLLINSFFSKVLSVVKSKLVLWLIIACLALASTVAYFYKSNQSLKQDNKRQSENFEQLNSENKVLNLTIGEYKVLVSKDKYKLDSLLKVIDESPKHLKSATIFNTEYRDTTIIEPIYLSPEKQPNSSSFIIPIEVNESCWGIKGKIISSDPNSRLKITERTASNSNQLLVFKAKRFLFIKIRKERYEAYSDCGDTIRFSQINFVKK